MSTDSPTSAPIVIVGGGLAAGTAAVTLREQGHTGPVVLFSAERHPPYERPPLSKDYLAGSKDAAALEVQPTRWYADHGVDLRLGTTVDRVDLERRVVVAGEEETPYDRLLLATGASPRHLPAADAFARGSSIPVHHLRTLDDSDALRTELRPGRRVVLVGGGWIGLEVAATARTLGAEVTVLEAGRLPLLGVLGEEVAHHFSEVHREHGVDLRVGAEVTEIREVDGMALVKMADGSGVAADVLVVGIGVVPATSLAEQAGLEVTDGIVVDDHLRTSDPHVYAAGDVALAHHPVLGHSLRVEHWANAKAQGAVAARNMIGGDVAHTDLPYFFTDQYDLGMEYFGHLGPEGFDEVVVEGDVAASRFVATWKRDGVVRAAMHVNEWDASDRLRALVSPAL